MIEMRPGGETTVVRPSADAAIIRPVKPVEGHQEEE